MKLHIENHILTGYSGNPDTAELLLSDHIRKIEFYTFRNWKKLAWITLPAELKSIEYGAFEECQALKEIQFPDGLEHIGHMAFLHCHALKKIEIPEHVNHIGYGAFADCEQLEEISVSENNPYFASADGLLYNKNFTELYCCPAGKKTVRIPDTVQKIRKFAFYGCRHLTEMQIPQSVNHIQYGAFRKCENLKQILIPVSVTQCENPDFPPDTLVQVQGNSGIMEYYPCEAASELSAILVLEKDFSVKMPHKIKYDLILRMLFAGISGTENYVRKNFSKIFKFLISQDDPDQIRKILEMQKFVSKRNISRLIGYADQNARPQCREILSHYREEKFL